MTNIPLIEAIFHNGRKLKFNETLKGTKKLCILLTCCPSKGHVSSVYFSN